MKFAKNNLAKKLIIILIVLLLFNTLYPSMSYAWDIGGILLQPVYWLLLSVYIPVDIAMGSLIMLTNMNWEEIGLVAEHALTEDLSGTGWNAVVEVVDRTGAIIDVIMGQLFIGPDTIFKGNIASFNANIFKNANRGSTDILTKVTKAVAKFYVILRDICAVIMLGGLIFTGIRILLSSNIPTKKTQYLMLLQDWIMGLALLIFSHVIMIFIFEMCDAITTALSVSIR